MNAAAASRSDMPPAPGTPATRASSAIFAVAAGRLKRITWSIMMPLASPWWRSATVDSACAQRVHGAQVLLEGDRAHHRAHQHVASRLQVAAVAVGDRQRPRGDAHALERDAVAHRMIFGRQVRLDVVRERVHAGGRGDRRRQVERQLGIGEHALREELRREDDLLDVRRVVRHHAERPTSDPVPAVVGSAMKCGSCRPIGRTSGWSHAYSRMSPGWRRHQRDRLRDVERRAAAQSDHGIGVVRLVGRDPFPDLAPDRIAPDAGEDADVEAPDSDATKSASSGSGAMPRSVTISGRLMSSPLRWSATSARAPGPKWMVVGKLNREIVMVAPGRGSCGSCRNRRRRRGSRAARCRRSESRSVS